MTTPRLSGRSIRALTTLTWLAAIAFAAWVGAELLIRFNTPERVAASFEPAVDPRAAAQRLATRAPLGGGATRPTGATAQARTNQSFELVGVATGFGRDPGFALIKPAGGNVQPFLLGDAIAPGVHLVALHPNQVEIERGGMREFIRLARDQVNAFPAPIVAIPDDRGPSNPANLR